MDKAQQIIYANETNKILKTIADMGLDQSQRLRAKNLALLFRDSFKSDDVRRATFPDEEPLAPEIAERIWPSNGFCRASSVAFCTLMGGAKNGWTLMAIPEIFAPYGPHHYILHQPSNTILDLTADQFTHMSGLQDIPYKYGKPIFDRVVANDSPANFANALGIDLVAEASKLKPIRNKNAKARAGR